MTEAVGGSKSGQAGWAGTGVGMAHEGSRASHGIVWAAGAICLAVQTHESESAMIV